MQPCHFHRECVVAGSHARAALQHDVLGLLLSDHCAEFVAQRVRRFETAVRREVVFEEAVACTGDMTGNRVDRLVFTAIAIGGACIDDELVARFHIG